MFYQVDNMVGLAVLTAFTQALPDRQTGFFQSTVFFSATLSGKYVTKLALFIAR